MSMQKCQTKLRTQNSLKASGSLQGVTYLSQICNSHSVHFDCPTNAELSIRHNDIMKIYFLLFSTNRQKAAAGNTVWHQTYMNTCLSTNASQWCWNAMAAEGIGTAFIYRVSLGLFNLNLIFPTFWEDVFEKTFLYILFVRLLLCLTKSRSSKTLPLTFTRVELLQEENGGKVSLLCWTTESVA